jgi:hypothetical protein
MSPGRGRPIRLGIALALSVALAPASVLRSQPAFREVAAELGLVFEHRHFGTGEKYMPENMGPGVAVFDFDGDSRLDVYVVQGAPIADGATADSEASNRLFRQQPDGSFVDVTASSGAGDRGYGMGVTFGDIDGDHDLDLFVTNFGPDALYENLGDGSFRDITVQAGVGGDGWSASAGFFDADGDGDLDLWVTRYVDFSLRNHKFCGNAQIGLRSYCHPDVYDGVPDLLYRNDGHGRFAEIGRDVGLVASTKDKGLGLAIADFDGDGRQDVYVANDSTMNYLYLGREHGHFAESALAAGVGYNASGRSEASMGVEMGDVDNDGALDLFVTHLDEETNTLYRGLGGGLWVDATEAAGLAAPSRPWVGFGTVLLDFDHDGDEDLFVANGHIIDNIERFDATRRHRQPLQLFENLGGRFVERSELLGYDQPAVARGAVGADLDDDGDRDLVITQNGGRLIVLRNDSPARGTSVVVRLVGSGLNTHAYGASVELIGANGVTQRQWLSGARSYLSQGPPQVHFGVGRSRARNQVIVHWPNGEVGTYDPVPPGAAYRLRQSSADFERLGADR